MCLITQLLEPCTHYECQYFYQSLSTTGKGGLSSETLAFVSNNLSRQTELLGRLTSANQAVLSLLGSITESVRSMQVQNTYATKANFIVHEEVSLETLLDDLPSKQFTYELQAKQRWPTESSKERGFALSLRVVNRALSPAGLPEGTRFRLALFTSDPSPKLLTRSISGKSVVRGSIEALASSQGEVYFPNIVVNEVSSHYYKEAFLLVVYCCVPSIRVKPFVIPNFRVRARRSLR